MRQQMKSADPVNHRRVSIPKIKSARAELTETRDNGFNNNQKEKRSK